MARKYVGFNVDTSEGDALTSYMQQLSAKMSTPAHIGPVLRYVHSELASEFALHMAAMAPANPSAFHHVYEWNRIGDPTQRLWRDVLRGGGNNRFATFEWRASRTVVPVREDAIAVNKDGNPAGSGELPKQIHVFVWKAPVMEYGEDIVIGPKRGKFIVYYTGPYSTNGQLYQEVNFSTKPITVMNPGGTAVKGAFTREYVRWWAGGAAAQVFNQRLSRVIEMNTKQAAEAGLSSIGSRRRNRTFTMGTMGSSTAAKAAGKAAAEKAMSRLTGNYIEQAIAREAFLQS
jgi:hypothetical protein